MRLSLHYRIPQRLLPKYFTIDDVLELLAEDRIQGWGEEREDARHSIRSYIAAAAAGVKNAKYADFIPRWEPPKAQTVEEAVRVAMKINAMCKGSFN